VTQTRTGGRVTAGLLLFALALFSFPSGAQKDDVGHPVLPPATTGVECVAPSDVMRRDHGKFLAHQRDNTVRSGIRGAKFSLTGCIGCHVQKDSQGVAIPINAPGQFCAACHRFTGVKIDCFECHATVPTAGTLRPGLPATGKAHPEVPAPGRERTALAALGEQDPVLPEWMSSPLVSNAQCSFEENG